MSYCGSAKCAADIYSASGCAMFAALTPTEAC
jgi:hypothetical protein